MEKHFGKKFANSFPTKKILIMGSLFRRLLIYAAPLALGYFMKKMRGRKQGPVGPR